jgi:sulfatase maturation enzyme AslB (radical SAM superfamily)
MYLGFAPLSDSLPVFTREAGDSRLYYAPGFVLRVLHEERAAVEAEIFGAPPPSSPIAELVRHATGAKARWNALFTQPYDPVCLTLYLDNRCNLACAYCYSDPSGPGSAITASLRLETIRSAAERVAQACSRRGLPLTLVLHGGGEPTLDHRLMEEALRVVDETAEQYQVATYKYLATNGVMPVETTHWVAAHFDLVGISCDGPADIQHRHRPLPNGSNSTPFVERTADILRDLDTAFHVRVTVTQDTLHRQEEIVAYICEHLAPLEIHLEPVYTGGRQRADRFNPGESDPAAEGGRLAEAFVTHFLRAQGRARSAGIPLLSSGSRPWEIHGPFCQVFRDVLQLVPGDAASPCFKLSDASQVSRLNAQIVSPAGEGFILDGKKIETLRAELRQQPARCSDCFNQYHCAKGCPDACPLEDDTGFPAFRCQVQMQLAGTVIERAASVLVVNQASPVAAAPIQVGT